MNSFYTKEELNKLGFKSIGENVLLSRKASIYNTEYVSIGNNVRIDDFCILSGNITIGNYVHISAYAALFSGKSGIEIGDFVALSSRVTIYSQSDDYSGESLTNPMTPNEYKSLVDKKVIIGKHVIVGSGSIILPGVAINEGTSVGALSLIKKDTEEWSIYVGIPASKIKNRKKDLLKLEKEFLKSKNEIVSTDNEN